MPCILKTFGAKCNLDSTENGDSVGRLEHHAGIIQKKSGKKNCSLERRNTKDLFFHFTRAWSAVPRTPMNGQRGIHRTQGVKFCNAVWNHLVLSRLLKPGKNEI